MSHPLVVDLEDLLEHGGEPVARRFPVHRAFLTQVLAGTDATVTRAGVLDCQLSLLTGGVVLVRGQLRAAFNVPCARCLEPAAVSADTGLCVRFERGYSEPQADEDDEEGLEIDPDEPDVHAYTGTTLDLRAMVGEHVLMAYPIRALCALGEDCRGLCTGCGAALNLEPTGLCPRCAPPEDEPAAAGSAWKEALKRLVDE